MSSSTVILIEQYKIAVDLYKHEDNLNWKKLNNLLYVNAGLVAILGIIAEGNTIGILPGSILLVMVSVIGLAVSAAFEIAIVYGIKYMHKRKDAVMEIEKKLVEKGGVRIVSPGEKVRKKGFLMVSPTTWMLRLVPLLFLILWATFLFITWS